MKYNKGEWSEAYAFVKLLGDGKVYAADENMKRNDDECYPIIKMIRDEISMEYFVDEENECVKIINSDGKTLKKISFDEFNTVATNSLLAIKLGSGASFEVPSLEKFLKVLGTVSFKSSSNEKSDFKMEIFDSNIEMSNIHTFSLKSYLGGNPTLLNASKATNFEYLLPEITDEEVNLLNNITGNRILKDRFQYLVNSNKEIRFVKTSSEVFGENLKLLDTKLPYMVSILLFYYYSSGNSSSIKDLTTRLIESNPLAISDDSKEIFYKTKIIDLIKAATLGMMPSKSWDKKYDVTGGILNVKSDGEILCHHLFYSINALDEYLYQNTKLETPSTTRHDFGYIYETEKGYCFKLNLQIRIK